MKKKYFAGIIILIISILVSAGCGAKNGDRYEPDVAGTEAGGMEITSEQERKIIYSGSLYITCAEIRPAVVEIKALLTGGEWVDYESVSSSRAVLTVRVATDRFDEFIGLLSELGEINDYTKKATDISLSYYDKQERIDTLEAELARLTELYKTASLSGMIEINGRISEVEKEIRNLSGELKRYDSLINYSELAITVVKEYTAPVEPAFGERLKNTFSGAWVALGDFFKGFVIVLTAVFPFLIVIILPAPAIIIIIVKLTGKKRSKRLKNGPAGVYRPGYAPQNMPDGQSYRPGNAALSAPAEVPTDGNNGKEKDE